MKKFKKIDVGISAALIIYFLTACIINYNQSGYFNLLITGYFIVGTWQVISMLVHLYYQRVLRSSTTRSVYHLITLIAIITMPIGSFWILVFTAPFMALFYTWLCIDEVRKMNQRPLAMLK